MVVSIIAVFTIGRTNVSHAEQGCASFKQLIPNLVRSYQYVLSFSMGSALGCDPSCKTLHMSMIIMVSFTSAAVEFILAFRGENDPHV